MGSARRGRSLRSLKCYLYWLFTEQHSYFLSSRDACTASSSIHSLLKSSWNKAQEAIYHRKSCSSQSRSRRISKRQCIWFRSKKGNKWTFCGSWFQRNSRSMDNDDPLRERKHCILSNDVFVEAWSTCIWSNSRTWWISSLRGETYPQHSIGYQIRLDSQSLALTVSRCSDFLHLLPMTYLN